MCIDLGGERQKFFDAVNYIADDAMMPLTIGGKIRTLRDVEECFAESVCDKILAEEHLDNLCHSVCVKFGKQSLVAGATEGRKPFPSHLIEYIGEIFVQSVDRDGSLRGYPIDFGKQFLQYGVPVIIGSGCEGHRSMLEGFNAGFDGCGTSNVHHWTYTGMKGIKTQLIKRGISLRNETSEVLVESRPAFV